VIDLARHPGLVGQGPRQQVGHLVAAVGMNRVGPGLADPGQLGGLLQFAVMRAHVEHGAVAVEHQRDVAGGVDQALRLRSIEFARQQRRVNGRGFGAPAHRLERGG
jgi:hypothetical protein